MLYLTGANTSLAKSGGSAIQPDPSKSLGGYASSNQVPSSAVNSLFDLISVLTLEKMQKETIGICLINKFPKGAKNISLKVIADDNNLTEFKVAAVAMGVDLAMERIASRYQEPMMAEFYNASFYRAGVNIKITNPAAVGEEFVLYPFDVNCTAFAADFYGTYSAIDEAFENTDWTVKRLTEDTLRIERLDEQVVSGTEACSFISDGNVGFNFDGNYRNNADNSVILVDSEGTLAPEAGIGIWLQRIIKKSSNKSDEVLVKEFKEKTVILTTEEVEIVIDYELIP